MKLTRRKALATAAAATVAASPIRHAAAAGAEPIRLGFLTVKTGPLASGGLQMAQGLDLFLKEQGNMLGGRPVQLFTEDTGGIPANALTKTQELVERDKVQAIIGPLAAFELLALVSYTEAQKIRCSRSRRPRTSASARPIPGSSAAPPPPPKRASRWAITRRKRSATRR